MRHLRLAGEMSYVAFEAVVVGLTGILLWTWDGWAQALRKWRSE